jgi:uncharacterized membrane protein
MGAAGFLERYFIEPLYQDAFNPVNTTVYAALFLVLVLLILRVFKRYDVSLDARFYSYFLGFIFLGALLGALGDVRFRGSPFFSTPAIYLGVSVLFLASITAGKLAERRLGVSYSLVPHASAYGVAAYLALRHLPENIELSPVAAILGLAVAPFAVVFLLLKKLGVGFLDSRVNQGVLFAHMLDASSTYLGVTAFGFGEKFFLMGYIIEAAPWGVFPVKALVVLLVLFYIEREDITVRSRDILKAALILLGLAPALRNTFLSVLL